MEEQYKINGSEYQETGICSVVIAGIPAKKRGVWQLKKTGKRKWDRTREPGTMEPTVYATHKVR